MPDVKIKTPNLDDIFEKWKQSAVRKDRKRMEKQFGTKGAVFSLDAISAAEYVKDTMKEAAIYFAVKKTLGAAPKGKEEHILLAPKLPREYFYSFKGSEKVNKDNWKGDELVPMYESIQPISCKKCGGKGYIDGKCKNCNGSGKIEENIVVFIGEQQKKEKKPFSYSCIACYGTGNRREPCKECGGHKSLYKYEILPVPFKTVVTGIPILHSSAQTKYEKEMGEDLHKMLEDVEGIKFSEFKELESKSEASLGYWNKNIKKTINSAGNDYKTYQKDKDTQITTQIYLFPLIQMFCETKKGKKFEIYSLGSANKFIIYSNF
ncbi:MAG: zinc finger-like domain-containing protein [Candidatus Heimdallarchaeota archaeon]